MEFIKNHSEFVLEDKYDAHNVVFDTSIFVDENVQEDILERMAEWQEFSFNDELQKSKIFKLHSLLSKYKGFETKGTHFTYYNSGMM